MATQIKKEQIDWTQEAWIAPTFVSPWTNYDGSWASARYMKDNNGFVHLRGLVKGGGANTTIFVLPAGYRPAMPELFPSLSYDLGSEGAARVDVNPDGVVRCAFRSGVGYLTLSGITFRAEQ